MNLQQPTTVFAPLIQWMVYNPIAAHLIMIFILCGGVLTAVTMQKEVFPAYELDTLNITMSYPGASPEEIEQGILQPIENAIQGTQGIKEMTSEATEGSAFVEVLLVSGTDRNKAFQDINQAVNRIRTFPQAAEDLEVQLVSNQREVMSVGLFGEVDTWTLLQLGERFRDLLLSQPAITQVELSRVPEYVTHIEITQETLRRYGLTLSAVAEIIDAHSKDIPAGTLESGQGEILMRVKSRKQWAEQVAEIPIITDQSGGQIHLKDIAQLTDGFEEGNFHSQFNQQPSIELDVFRVGNQSPLKIAAAVEESLQLLAPSLPVGVNYRVDFNSAEDFKDRLALLLENGLMAAVIVFAILALFLKLRLAFWIMMGMVLSFIGGVLLMPYLGVSINMISMFAFLVVLGIVVDDAIVVGENIHQFSQRGLSPKEAAVAGTQDIATPVTFTILTTVVAFAPILWIPGTTGQYWQPFPVVVITVLLVSLFEALLILPAHLAHVRDRSGKRVSSADGEQEQLSAHSTSDQAKPWFKVGSDRFKGLEQRYQAFITSCVTARYITFTCAVAVIIISGAYALSDHMGFVMMPRVAADEIEAGVRLPVGTTLNQVADVAKAVTDSSQRMFETHDLYRVAEGIKTNVRGKTFIDVEIVMKPPDQRDMSARDVIELWRDQIGDLEGVDQITFEAERGPGGWRDDISIDVSHDDLDQLVEVSQALKERVNAFTNTRNVNDSHRMGRLQYSFKVRPQASQLGLTPEAIGAQIRAAFFGAVALRQLRGTNEVEFRVKLPRHQRQQAFTLESLIIRTPSGIEVPLDQVVTIETGEAYSALNRRNGRRVINVGMDVEPQSAINSVLTAIRNDVLPELQQQYPGLTWAFRGSQAEMRSSAAVLWGGFAIALFLIYSLLAVVFKSYSQPFIILSAIPFGIIGVVFGHLLLGFDLSLVSLMGTVALSGVVVNGSLIMVDYANKRVKQQDLSPQAAIIEASSRRFRPIMLTTLTTFLGLTPIISESSRQAAQLIPMAISLGFGILFASIVLLVLVPCLYMMLEDLKHLLGNRLRTSRETCQ